MSEHPIFLEGRHSALVPMELAHVDALLEIGLEPSIWQFTLANVTNRPEMESYVRAALDDRDKNNAIPLVTMAKTPSGLVAVGSTRFFNNEQSNKRVEIGHTWIAPAWQRTVINTEVKYLMLRYAFETLGYNRVEFKTDATNMKSRTAIKRLGAVEEGTFRMHSIATTSRVRDSVYFSIIAPEWPAVKAGLEAKLTV